MKLKKFIDFINENFDNNENYINWTCKILESWATTFSEIPEDDDLEDDGYKKQYIKT